MTEEQVRLTAVDRAYRDHADDVYRVAYAILRDPDAAMDATHDAFALAYRRWDQYDANRPVRPWLHGIVSHLALDAVRRRRVRVKAIDVLGRAQVEQPAIGPGSDDMVRRLADRDLVDDVLGSLKPDVRAALVLRHYYGYDYAAIAAFLRTNPGTVGSILSRAHASLRERLSNEPTPGAVDDDIARDTAR